MLPFCVESLRRHPQVTTISVIAPTEVEPDCARLGVGFIEETSLLEHWFPPDVSDRDTRWYYQMLLKLSVAYRDADRPDRFLIIDADTTLLNDVPLIDPGSGTVQHPRTRRVDEPYFNGIRHLLGHDVERIGSYTSHMMVYRTPVIHAMFAEFARVQDRPPEEGLDVLRSFLQRCDREQLSFSDYETYGYFARERYPDEMVLVDRRHLNVLYVAPSEHAMARLRPFYDYASFHAYRRPHNAALRAAGATWFALRLVRDRLAGRSAVHGVAEV